MAGLIGPIGARRTRRLLVVPALAALILALLLPGLALAVHDLQFQLDGDVSAATTTNVGGSTQSLDWDSFFDSAGNVIAGSITGTGSGGNGFTNAGVDREPRRRRPARRLRLHQRRRGQHDRRLSLERRCHRLAGH